MPVGASPEEGKPARRCFTSDFFDFCAPAPHRAKLCRGFALNGVMQRHPGGRPLAEWFGVLEAGGLRREAAFPTTQCKPGQDIIVSATARAGDNNAGPGQPGREGKSRRPPIGHCMKTHTLTQEQTRRRYQVAPRRSKRCSRCSSAHLARLLVCSSAHLTLLTLPMQRNTARATGNTGKNG